MAVPDIFFVLSCEPVQTYHDRVSLPSSLLPSLQDLIADTIEGPLHLRLEASSAHTRPPVGQQSTGVKSKDEHGQQEIETLEGVTDVTAAVYAGILDFTAQESS